MDREYIEKWFDLTEAGVEWDIKKYLANGWIIQYQGLTLLTMIKYI